MCGISGILNYGDYNKSLENINGIHRDLYHRGPDQQNIYYNDKIIFSHRRLSIIDLSTNGMQPMKNNDESVIIVFNGEIYNFLELKEELTKGGYKFKSRSDTEVILNGYREWGENVIKKLNGMFAFVIYDKNTGKTIIARDRSGQKPIYYFEENGTLVFSSEVGPLINHLGLAEIDREALIHYLSFQIVPSNKSIIRLIKKIPPGSYLRFAKKKVTIKKYWDLEFSKPYLTGKKNILKKLDSIVKNSVKSHLVSDVPVGTFLSGGLDSSLITALTSIELRKKIHTFSIGFNLKGYDESKYSEIVSKEYGTEHHSLMLQSDCLNILPKLIWHCGEPFADFSIIPTYYVSELASRYVKVILSGDGADEIFGGYSSPIRNYQYEKFRKIIPKNIRNISSKLALKSRLFKIKKVSLYNKLNNFLTAINEDSLENYFSRSDDAWYHYLDDLVIDHDKNSIKKHYADLFNAKETGEVNKLLYLGYKEFLPNDMLTKVDIASMANSLEVRCPFLDNHLVDFSAKIDNKYKFGFTEGKIILKELASNYLPKSIVWRKKMGFTPPLDHWIREEKWKHIIKSIISKSSFINSVIHSSLVERIFEEHINSDINNSKKIWTLLCLAIWHDIYIEKILSGNENLDEHPNLLIQ